MTILSRKTLTARGVRDLYGENIEIFNYIINIAKKVALNADFEEISTPIFEFSEVFERNLGANSDIISKEVYKFSDRSNNFLTLRPEFTAGVIRSFVNNGDLNQYLPQKLFSFGPLFRYERPQKGRQRQFHQVNFENIGIKSSLVDAELISLAYRFLKNLNLQNKSTLQINSLGCEETKHKYQKELVLYLNKYQKDLSEDSKVRLLKNPLRILDSKNTKDIEIVLDAPEIKNFYSKDAAINFEKILNMLTKLNIDFIVNQKLVRGLDYYTSTVFEFTTTSIGAQDTILAGGRYDSLIKNMGGGDIPASGFAAGIERIMLLSEIEKTKKNPTSIIFISPNEEQYAATLAHELRNSDIHIKIYHGLSFKKQMKLASKDNSKYVLIIGENEVKNNDISVKNFQNSQTIKIHRTKLNNFLQQNAMAN
ncbi:histidine--tRNA ligase [Flavobacteriaceae bacterium]|nr:histidine--tRNA ligase [Flavobacteriaceae bacterium]